VDEVEVSHDVDLPHLTLGRGLRGVAGDLARDLGGGALGQAAARARSWVRGRLGRWDGDPADTFDLLMDAAEGAGLQATFYFMAGRSSPAHDASYELEHPWVRALLGRIGARGHLLGLHGSYGAYLDPAVLARELARLRRVAGEAGVHQERWGGRQHYLRFRAPETWRAAATAGLAHDATLGYADAPGYRAGTRREYPVYDLLEDRPLELRERPLAVMDVTLSRYQGLALARLPGRLRELAGGAAPLGGPLRLLVHNNEPLARRAGELYPALLQAPPRAGG